MHFKLQTMRMALLHGLVGLERHLPKPFQRFLKLCTNPCMSPAVRDCYIDEALDQTPHFMVLKAACPGVHAHEDEAPAAVLGTLFDLPVSEEGLI